MNKMFPEIEIDSNLSMVITLLALVAIAVGAYLIRVSIKGKATFARVDKEQGSAILSKSLMEMAYWWIQPIAKALASWGVSPDFISWTALVFGLLAGICLGAGHFGFGATLFLISGFLDALDGLVARIQGVANDAGGVLDTVLDRYVDSFFLGGLAIFYRDDVFFLFLVLAAWTGSFAVTFTSWVGKAVHIEPPRAMMKRPERLFYLILGCVLSAISIPVWEQQMIPSQHVGYPMVVALFMVAILSNYSAWVRVRGIQHDLVVRSEETAQTEKVEASDEAIHSKTADRTV